MKKRIYFLLVIALLIASLALAACGTPAPTSADITPSGTFPIKPSESAAATGAAQSFTGYLVDQKCGISGIDIQDGMDLTKHPEKHQLSCAKMPGCLASGFGLFIQQTDGTYKFYKFDAAGSQMAIDSIIHVTAKQDNFLVDVAGTMSGDTITVSSIVLK
jgi:hypothetical protein